MPVRRLPVLSVIAALMLSACATTYDPAEVCTSQWIKPRAERAVGYIENDAKSVIKNLKKAGESYASGGKPGPITLWKLSNSVKALERELREGRGMKDLKILANTCDDPNIVSDAMTGLMRDNGMPEQMIRFIEDMPMYREILNEGLKQSAVVG